MPMTKLAFNVRCYAERETIYLKWAYFDICGFMARHMNEIMIKGKFGRDCLKVRYKPGRQSYGHKANELIELKWNEFLALNPKSYNGPLFRVNKWSDFNSRDGLQKIELHLTDTNYKEFVGTRNPEFIATFGKEQISNPLSAGAVLITKDNKLILGRRSSSIDGSKYALSVIAGYLDPQKDILRIHNKDGSDYVDFVDIFHGIEREIYEETGIAAYDVVELVCLGIIANRKENQMNIPFCGTLNISSDEVVTIRSKTQDSEFSEILFVQNDLRSINEFMNAQSNEFSDLLNSTLEIYSDVTCIV
jgi:8-oxo-dGTP pyrophosphatase MutT (NUDIX family)